MKLQSSVIVRMRRWLRLALSLYVGFFVYIVLDSFAGESGLVAHDRLMAHRDRLTEAIEEQKSVGSYLEASQRSLLSDPEEIRLLARQLGYFRANEIPMRLSEREMDNPGKTLGRLVRRPPTTPGSPGIFRLSGLVSALVAFLLVTFLSGRHANNNLQR